ncbi:hypothetical protein [Vreelandella populi]|uniref:hypothetical protein n=1 Tax=Halomonadaceae TaxID=28256 RepID=UPI0030EC2A75
MPGKGRAWEGGEHHLRTSPNREVAMQAITTERPIGVISDTHGLLRPEALDMLAGCGAWQHRHCALGRNAANDPRPQRQRLARIMTG